jgi:hypothetical protein
MSSSSANKTDVQLLTKREVVTGSLFLASVTFVIFFLSLLSYFRNSGTVNAGDIAEIAILIELGFVTITIPGILLFHQVKNAFPRRHEQLHFGLGVFSALVVLLLGVAFINVGGPYVAGFFLLLLSWVGKVFSSVPIWAWIIIVLLLLILQEIRRRS